jgi:hypothetical protein
MGIAAEHLSAAELQSISAQILTEPRPEGEDVWAHCPWHTETTPGNAFYYTPGRDWGYCHSCGNTGDIIDIYAAIFGLENREAVKNFMQAYCPQAQRSGRVQEHRRQTPRMPQDQSAAWSPKTATTPAGLWLEHAVKMVSWSQEQLAKNEQARDYLSGRGIPPQALQDYGLGLIPQNIWRERRSWGLDPKYRDDGKEKKLWIPAGITIPYYLDGTLHRVRIRRWDGDPRYYWVPGSGNQTMLLRRKAGTHLPDAAVVVETELDAIALHHAVGDLVHVVALGSSSAKPRTPVYDLLQRCTSVLVAADFDQAGITAWQWWGNTFAQAQLWPSPAGKDVGDAAQAGLPLRDWIVDGLPPAWTIGPSASGRLYQGGGDASESEDQLLKAAQAACPDMTQVGEHGSHALDLSDSVQEFVRMVSSNPVQIVVTDDRVAVRENPAWAREHWDMSKRISDLLYFDDDVLAWVTGHAQKMGGVIHAGNIQTK